MAKMTGKRANIFTPNTLTNFMYLKKVVGNETKGW
jgi:hypothetical protein